MPVTVTKVSDIFSSWCPHIPHPIKGWLTDGEHWETDEEYWEQIDKTYGFRLRVVVPIDIPSRHSTFSWIRGMGVTKFDEIFQGELNRLPYEWLLAFPERHCTIQEQAALIKKLVELNRQHGSPMKMLDIITQSPYIISDTRKECLSCIQFPEGRVTYQQDYML